jgi:hypothetical protein
MSTDSVPSSKTNIFQSKPQSAGRPIGKPRVSPLRFLNTSAVIRYLICVYTSHFFAGRPYHFNQTFFKASSIHSSIVAILELIRGAQCLIEVIRSSGEEMWCVDAYQIPYYSRGIEEAKSQIRRYSLPKTRLIQCMRPVSEWVSEWVFNANLVLVQLYHGKNKLIFNEMMMRSALY